MTSLYLSLHFIYKLNIVINWKLWQCHVLFIFLNMKSYVTISLFLLHYTLYYYFLHFTYIIISLNLTYLITIQCYKSQVHFIIATHYNSTISTSCIHLNVHVNSHCIYTNVFISISLIIMHISYLIAFISNYSSNTFYYM